MEIDESNEVASLSIMLAFVRCINYITTKLKRKCPVRDRKMP
jgi:hypothetical protein